MNEPRHNTHLIVTVLSAWVALMCGMPATQAAPVQRNTAPVAVHYRLQGNAQTRFEFSVRANEGRRLRRSVSFARLRSFKPAAYLPFLDLVAFIPRIDLPKNQGSFTRECSPVRESTRSLSEPINLSIVSLLPRAGLA